MAETFIPVVGQQVTVELINCSAVDRRLFPDMPEHLVYEGTIVSSANYDPKESFRITGDVLMPVRVIHKGHVVSCNGKKVGKTTELPAVRPQTFPVKGSKGNDYVVAINEQGQGSCTCSGYGFRRKCSHIDGVLATLGKK